MKKIITLAVWCVCFSSCKISAPTFKSLDQWRVSNISTSSVTLSNSAYFYNPNNINGIKLTNVTIDLLANGRKLGTIVNSNGNVIIPKQADFAVPLSINVNPSDLINGIGDILSAALGGSIDIRCMGNVDVGYMIISKRIPIDQTLPVSISAIK